MNVDNTLLIALADDSDAERRAAELSALGVDCACKPKSDAATSLSENPFVAVLVDWKGGDDGAFVQSIVSRHADVRVIALTEESFTAAVDALRGGAWDVLPRTADAAAVADAFRRALEANEKEPDALPPPPVSDAGLVGASRPMEQVRDTIRRAATGSATVLIRGESGTGKELVARAIHEASRRAQKPFVKIHCAALPDTLLESELFGYEKGAFTGAVARKPGRVDVAEGGTLFLDEIGDITLAMQVKLLRLLQDKEYERLGSTQTLRANLRFIAATHRDLENMVARREFREDLFYRLNVVPLWLPPLRIRHGDIDLLARHFCAASGRENSRPAARLTEGALEILRAQRWPGNVRQLQNFVERLVVLSDEEVIADRDVKRELSQGIPFPTLATKPPSGNPPEGLRAATPAAPSSSGAPYVPLDKEIRKAEAEALVRALKHARGNRTLAARLLGVGRATLYKKMHEYGVS
jgi:two-component system, NtrC family, response regulator AtoC